MSIFLQVTSVVATRENALAGNPSYSKQCVVVGFKANMPIQQECNKYKDIFNSTIYGLKVFTHIIHIKIHIMHEKIYIFRKVKVYLQYVINF